jgi:hypothetical protein
MIRAPRPKQARLLTSPRKSGLVVFFYIHLPQVFDDDIGAVLT